MPAHEPGAHAPGWVLKMATLATLAFFGVELAAGYWARSLALVSAAWHNFSDALVLLGTWQPGTWLVHPAIFIGRVFPLDLAHVNFELSPGTTELPSLIGALQVEAGRSGTDGDGNSSTPDPAGST